MTATTHPVPKPPTRSANLATLRRRTAASPLWALIAVGVLIEAALVQLLLRPFSLVRLTGPQLAPEPFVSGLPPGGRGLGIFLVTWASLFGLYFLALAFSRGVDPRRLMTLAAGFALMYALTLWPTIALGSTDLYHYILDGRALALHGGNPLVTPPAGFWNDELAHILFFNTENTGAYGPLFYTLAAGAALLGHGDLVWSTAAIKGIAVAWLLACLPLVYLLAERMRAGRGGAALLAFGWNPLVLFEVAGSGHNDIGVAFFGLLAYWLALTGRWRWAPAALALGMLVKPTALLLLPPLLAWLCFQPDRPTPRALALALGAAAAVVVAAYLPFWAGTETFSQLRHLATLRMNSPADVSVVLLSERMDPDVAARLVKGMLSAAFLLAAAVVLLRTRGPRPRPLLWSAFWCLFAYYMIACWWFWPWYLVPMAAFGAALWPGRAGSLTAVFSCSALLLYAMLGWRETLFTYSNPISQALGAALTVFLAPALLWLSGWWSEVATERDQ